MIPGINDLIYHSLGILHVSRRLQKNFKGIAEEKFTKSVFWMTYGVLYFLSNFARNAKYSIIISGHLPFLTLKSGIVLLYNNQT